MRTRLGWLAIGILLALTPSACYQRYLTPSELEAVQDATDAYLAYARGDCTSVKRMTSSDVLESWAINETKHSAFLLNGFCRELEGDRDGAMHVYRELIRFASDSFAAQDARERMRILKRREQDPNYEQWVEAAEEAARGIGAQDSSRVPIERRPAHFPPLAKAAGLEGFAVVDFGITRRGKTTELLIVDSKPPLIFDGATLRAVRDWKFAEDSSSPEDHRQTIRLLFVREDPSATVPVEETGLEAN